MSDTPDTATPGPAPQAKPTARPALLFKEDSTHGESRAINISLRGWIALLVVASFCYVCIRAGADAPALMKDVALMVLTFYFVTKPNPPAK